MRATCKLTASSAIISRSSGSSPVSRSRILVASCVFLAIGFLIEMKLRVLLESLFSAEGSLDLGVGNLVFLGQAMGEDDHVLAMEKVEDPVVDAPLASA